VTKPSARKQLHAEESLSARRREAVSRSGLERSVVDMGDVQQLRDHLAHLEHVLLQWAYATARAERAAEKQQVLAEAQLRAVWASVNQQRSRALAGEMEAARQTQAQQLQDRLQVQYDHLLPIAPAVEEFVRNYSQLSESIASTMHALPVSEGSCDEGKLVDALKELEKHLTLPESAAAVRKEVWLENEKGSF
jgi:hypothetical protein